ncbi:isopentenyl-diphosphate Delta-isomerase [Acetivibrio clariflavus]|uniref:Isopentenyl-diphosphate delta-isomerase n=1 Tax=Acetivibrio clariflavus (strain DSM 19732 / NBRC 101661 / EBR45) TaxID=720554 RepID=G8LVY4_ACECE|nr:isopentenyl-diphosphate Delta-isomerase [Acetivibrio clariflavus]AEV67551.1 isopentenyl-diphosphate delta-isomerase [Acetivibrio clariflavus DSM 19732]
MIIIKEYILLVNEDDEEIGIGEKMEVHKTGQLHRAFSIFVFNSENKLLLQKRAISKYHSGGLLTNTCCSHQRKGEDLYETIHTRLMEEMGFDCDLEEIFTLKYRAELDNGLIEHEIDHVFIGRYDGDPVPNPDEVDDYAWVDLEDVLRDVSESPENFTCWFRLLIGIVAKYVTTSS